MARKQRTESDYATSAVTRVARQLGLQVRQARSARNWTQADLAARARISAPTMHRLEGGNVATSLGVWLGVLERVGLLAQFEALEDPASKVLLQEAMPKRAHKRRTKSDTLDF